MLSVSKAMFCQLNSRLKNLHMWKCCSLLDPSSFALNELQSQSSKTWLASSCWVTITRGEPNTCSNLRLRQTLLHPFLLWLCAYTRSSVGLYPWICAISRPLVGWNLQRLGWWKRETWLMTRVLYGIMWTSAADFTDVRQQNSCE